MKELVVGELSVGIENFRVGGYFLKGSDIETIKPERFRFRV